MRILLIYILFFNAIIAQAEENSILIKTNERHFQIAIQTSVSHWGSGHSETNLFLGFIGSNSYQQSYNIRIDSLGKKIAFGFSGDSCIYYNFPLGLNSVVGKKIELLNQYTVSVHDITTNFDLIDTIYPYDTQSLNVINYTKSRLPFIDIENKQLLAISDSIWNESKDVLNYAKNCYLFVAEHFTYLDPLTGFHSLEDVLKNKGADCGNLSSVFITLLRIKKIPARHLMGFRPDGTLHVWSDFYLEKYGWIPVDVTYKNAYPKNDYFGNIKFEESGFIVNRDISNVVVFGDEVGKINGLQTYSYEVKYSKEDKAKVYIDRKIICHEIRGQALIEIPCLTEPRRQGIPVHERK